MYAYIYYICMDGCITTEFRYTKKKVISCELIIKVLLFTTLFGLTRTRY